jgi:hypothetical protein
MDFPRLSTLIATGSCSERAFIALLSLSPSMQLRWKVIGVHRTFAGLAAWIELVLGLRIGVIY